MPPMQDPTDAPPPPSYQMSVEEFDRKTSQAMQLASSTTYAVDEDGWPIYDPAAFEAAGESSEHPPSSSSSAGFPSTETNRHVRQSRPLPLPEKVKQKVKHSSRPTKTRSSERDSQDEDEPRSASPPPPFTTTGPSLDGPPFEEVVTLSYRGADSSEDSPPSPRSPPLMLQPIEPLRLRSNRSSSNPYPSHRQVPPRPNLPPAIARVEFDPQMAYSPYHGVSNHTSIREGALAFYNHAVASQLMTSPNMTAQTQSSHTDRPYSGYTPAPYWAEQAMSYNHAVASQLTTGPTMTAQTQSGHTERPYSGYTPAPYWAEQAMSSVSLHGQQAPHLQSFHSSAPAVPPPPSLLQSHPTSGVGYTRPSPSENVRGPLPSVPAPLSQPRWAGSGTQIVQDVYGGHS